jgi:lupus La protein
MWESCEGSENKPIAISKIHSFKRMRTFQPYSAVVAALRDSTSLEVSGEEGSETVKRKTPYKPLPEGKVKAEAATVYVKGFGDENPDTQFDLESFFAQFGEVKGLKLRRTNENLFKGSVFVTFVDEDAAKKFLATEPKPNWKGHELKIMSKKEYCNEKSDLIRQGKIEPSSSGARKFYEGKDGAGRSGKKGSRDQDDWKKRRENDQKNGFRDGRGGRGGRGRGGRGGRGRGGGRGGRGRDGGRRDTEQVKDATYSE